jgi:ribosomal protein S18 acetylase RimI-like enzyme
MIKIVEGGPRHASIIRDIAIHTWPTTFRQILSQEQIVYMLKTMYDLDVLKQQWKDGHQFLLSKYNGHFYGFLTLKHSVNGERSTKINKLYVLPEAQGLGLGYHLLTAAQERAIEKGSQALVLNVNKYNQAIKFYERNGFEIISSEVIDIGEGYVMDDFVMKKSL